jgi:hypothetical protein
MDRLSSPNLQIKGGFNKSKIVETVLDAYNC